MFYKLSKDCALALKAALRARASSISFFLCSCSDLISSSNLFEELACFILASKKSFAPRNNKAKIHYLTSEKFYWNSPKPKTHLFVKYLLQHRQTKQ